MQGIVMRLLHMNNILFGTIGLLMLAIVGLGFAEVKYQAHGGDYAAASEQSSVSDVAGVSGAPATSLDTAVPQENTVSAGVSQAAAKVRAAYSGDSDNDSDDEGGDDDGDDDSRGAPATVTPQPATTKPAPTTPAAPTPSSGTFSMAQIASHNTAASCYSAINGNVYDLTSFVSRHPGGAAAITSLCGVDGTSAYMGQHGSSRRPANELASLKIGVLSN